MGLVLWVLKSFVRMVSEWRGTGLINGRVKLTNNATISSKWGWSVGAVWRLMSCAELIGMWETVGTSVAGGEQTRISSIKRPFLNRSWPVPQLT